MGKLEQFMPEARIEAEKPYSSRIVLSLFRHSKKENEPPEGEVGDENIRLTEEGRALAVEAGAAYRPTDDAGLRQSVALGSPRKRAQETVGLVMAGAEPEISGDETLEELKQKLSVGGPKAPKIGKLGTDRRLDYDEGSGKYLEGLSAGYEAGQAMRWIVDQSDQAAREAPEDGGTSYLRMAGNIAETVERYRRSAGRFDELVRGGGYDDTMRRFFGTHLMVGESFLARLLEKTRGPEERDRFLTTIGNGFNFVEGFQIEIDTPVSGGEPVVNLHYQGAPRPGVEPYEVKLSLTKELLQEMISERDEFNAEVATGR
jgi:hypothetical protein